MTLYPVQGIAYDPTSDEVVEGATGGVVYASLEDATAGVNPITVYGNVGEALASVTSNASGLVVFNYADRLEGWVKFPSRPAIHMPSSAVPGLLNAALAAQTAAEAAAKAAQDAAASVGGGGEPLPSPVVVVNSYAEAAAQPPGLVLIRGGL